MVVIIRAPIARANAGGIMHMPWKAVRAVKGMDVYDMKGAVYKDALAPQSGCCLRAISQEDATVSPTHRPRRRSAVMEPARSRRPGPVLPVPGCASFPGRAGGSGSPGR